MDRIEKIKEFLNSLDSEYLIVAWNERCSETDMDDYIYDNDEHFFNEFFQNPDDAVRAVCFGDYHYNDTYVVFNGYGNLDTFNFSDCENSPIDIDTLAEWIDEKDGCECIELEEGYDEIFNNEDEEDNE